MLNASVGHPLGCGVKMRDNFKYRAVQCMGWRVLFSGSKHFICNGIPTWSAFELLCLPSLKCLAKSCAAIRSRAKTR